MIAIRSKPFDAVVQPGHMINHSCHRGIPAFTLVELMVVVMIIGILIAISVPMLKPMLESDKTRSAAQRVTTYLEQARIRAMETGLPCGVQFERCADYNLANTVPYNNTCIVMRQVAVPSPYAGSYEGVRVSLELKQNPDPDPITGFFKSYYLAFNRWNGTAWVPETNLEMGYWQKLVQSGDQVQFNLQGPFYRIAKDSANSFFLDKTYLDDNKMMVPKIDGLVPAAFKVHRTPKPTLTPPAILPSGLVIDLAHSGMGRSVVDSQCRKTPPSNIFDVTLDDFRALSPADRNPITIMFLPDGSVDHLYFHNNDPDPLIGNSSEGTTTHDPIYLCIGIWDRVGMWEDIGSGVWAVTDKHIVKEDLMRPNPRDINLLQKRRNYEDLNNSWVTIFPTTGTIRINKVSAINKQVQLNGNSAQLSSSRKYAESLHDEETK